MTAVHVDLEMLDLDNGGTEPIGAGHQHWQPTQVVHGGAATLLPIEVQFDLPGGTGTAEVVPTQAGWAYRVETYVVGKTAPALIEYVLVADVPAEEFSTLPRINPKTLAVIPTTPAWVAALNEILDAAVEGAVTDPRMDTILSDPDSASHDTVEAIAALLVAVEATARAAGDTAEATARAAGDTAEASARTTAITAEATARAAAIAAEATARAAAIAAAIAALVDASPTALDTLNELAAALGDDPNFSATVSTQLGLKATTAALDAETAARAAAITAEATARAAADATLQASIATAVEDAVAAHTPGIELGYAERVTNFATTATAPGAAALIPGLSMTIVGTGRPVDVEFFAQTVVHSVATGTDPASAVLGYLEVNGAVNSAFCQSAVVSSPSNTVGRTMIFRRRVILTSGASYTFKVGIYGLVAGTATVVAPTYAPAALSVTSR